VISVFKRAKTFHALDRSFQSHYTHFSSLPCVLLLPPIQSHPVLATKNLQASEQNIYKRNTSQSMCLYKIVFLMSFLMTCQVNYHPTLLFTCFSCASFRFTGFVWRVRMDENASRSEYTTSTPLFVQLFQLRLLIPFKL
jgi:hypothetical protein